MASSTEWHLGLTSEQHESGGRGPGTISTGKDDPGGISYGSYQLSTNAGTLQEYLDQSAYKDQFNGLAPATPSFDAKWRELAGADPGFGQDQHDFIRKTHYDVQVVNLKANGVDLTARGPAVQDALWSTSVQYRGLTQDVFAKGLREKFGKDFKLSDLSDKDIVEAAQDYKIAHNEQLFRSSPAETRHRILNRIESEKSDLLNLADGKVIDRGAHHRSASRHVSDGDLHQGDHGAAVNALQADLAALGYTDNRGRPLPVDGHFGRNTEASVRAFQSDHGLFVDGIAGKNTLDAIDTQRQLLSSIPALAPELEGHPRARIGGSEPAHRAAEQSSSRKITLPGNAPVPNPLADPRHPDHGLYTELKERISDASENRLVQLAVACHVAGIRPGYLGDIHIGKQGIVLASYGPGPHTIVDISLPAPPIQHTVQQMQAFDFQLAQQQQQTMHQHGPVVGGQGR